MSPSSAQGMKYAKNEKVLCFHGPLLYEAKVLDTDMWDEATYGTEAGPHFFVHYQGVSYR